MARYVIKRATPRADFTVAIEWADGSSSKVDFRPEIARGGALASLGNRPFSCTVCSCSPQVKVSLGKRQPA